MALKSDTAWFREAKWGVFIHYLASPASSLGKSAMTVPEWNRRIDNFNAEQLAGQLAEVGAGYCFLTLGQNSGFYLSPNSTYDAIVGHEPSHCSRRDLVSDLHDALSRHGIKLLVYVTNTAPMQDEVAIEKLKCTPPWEDRDPLWCGLKVGDLKPLPGVDSRMTEFQHHWEAVIREWSLRWGRKVSGWWIDGCYHPDLMYEFPDEPNFKSFIAALKAGNPDSIVSFAVKCGQPEFTTAYDDYTPGEINYLLPAPGRDAKFGGDINGAQYHILTFMGEYWGAGTPRFSDALAVAWTREIIKHQGVVTWDVKVNGDGLINEAFFAQLHKIGKSAHGQCS